MIYDSLIIGSGLSGLACAQELHKNGLSVLVVDKGFLPGGRTASKIVQTEIGTAVFDYGAQYFTVESIEFLKQVNEWIRNGLVEKWATVFDSLSSKRHDTKPRYKALPFMRNLCIDLCNGLEIKQQTKIVRIEKAEQEICKVITETGDFFETKALIITAPIAQSLELCYQSGIIPDFNTVSFFNQQKYHPCTTLMIASDTESTIPEPGGMWCDPVSHFQWMADNKKKGISEITAITANLTPEFSKVCYSLTDEEVFDSVSAFLSTYVPGNYIFKKVHRWRYAQPVNIVETGFIRDEFYPNLWFAGDVFLNGRVESAWLSGYNTAKAILKSIG
jgi:renalase